VSAGDTTLHVLWLNAGLSCDGDSVSLTAATQPSIEDLIGGALPGVPPLDFHWPLLAMESGEAFLAAFHDAAAGRLDPFVLVVEGSIANEEIKDAGYFTGFGTDAATGQPITTSTWLDRLDGALRPKWLFELTVHEGCDRAGFYEQGDFAASLSSHKCIVKQGCWGPVVKCNVPKRGWINGIGGCPNVGGICIGCTMPGFPDKFMPFMDEPPGGKLSSMLSRTYGSAMRRMREFTMAGLDDEPAWRRRGQELLSGYQPRW